MTKKLLPPKSPKYPTIDVYFHMTNHYRKLKNVKSTIDTHLFKAGYQKCRSRSQVRTQSVTPNEQKCDTDEFCCPVIKYSKQNDAPSQSRSSSLPPRPPTRRSVFDMPEDVEVPIRSVPKSQTKLSTAPKRLKHQQPADKPIVIKDEPFISAKNDSVSEKTPSATKEESMISAVKDEPPVPAVRTRTQKTLPKSNTQQNKPIPSPIALQSIKDHEYLQFSLRITEDIIRNDLYTNKNMKRVFNSHIEANRGRLDMQKMKEQVEKLYKELNIPLDETNDDASPSLDDLKRTHKNLQTNLICICGPNHQRTLQKTEDRNCECNDTRCVPLQCAQHPPANTEVMPQLHLMNAVSLECVTEVTEPSSSFGTITSISEKVSNSSVDNKDRGFPRKQNHKESKTKNLHDETMASVFQAKLNKDERKPSEDGQKEAHFKRLATFAIKETPKSPQTDTESNVEKPKLFSNTNEEYVLITGPIYIPKSVLQHSNLEKSATLKNPPPFTYSMIHSKADGIKHEVSYSSNYPYDGLGRILQGQGLVIDSKDFKAPPKILQLKNIKDGDAVSFQTNETFLPKESLFLNRTDYDETPQRDSDHPGYKVIYQTRETSVASDVISTDQQIDVEPKKITTSLATPRNIAMTTNHRGSYSSAKRKITDFEPSDIKEISKQDLLLGDDYKLISPADVPYDSCLPYPLNLFYLTIATQTTSSDFIAAEQMWTMESHKETTETIPIGTSSEITDISPEKSTEAITDESESKRNSVLVPSEAAEEPTNSVTSAENLDTSPKEFETETTKTIIEESLPKPKSALPSLKAAEEMTTSGSSSENVDTSPKKSPKRSTKTDIAPAPLIGSKDSISIGGSIEIKDVSLKSSSGSNNDGNIDNTAQSITSSSGQSVNKSETSVEVPLRNPQSINFDLEKKVESSSQLLTEPAKSRGSSTLKQSSKERDSLELKYSSNDIQADEDGVKEPSFESVTKSDDSEFTILCKKLDTKHSSSPTNSQLLYIQDVVKELDKYRIPESEPQMAIAKDSVTASLKIASEHIIASVSRPSVGILRPLSKTVTVSDSDNPVIDDDDETKRFCGFPRKKKKKVASPSASTEIIYEETGKQGIADITGKSIRFDDPGIYHHFQKQYPKHVDSTHSETSTSQSVN